MATRQDLEIGTTLAYTVGASVPRIVYSYSS